LYVCTSKPRRFAVRILDWFKLSSHFTAIYGDKAEYASHSKALLLATLAREHSLRPETCLMIGDRIYDFQAAHACAMRCVAAGWGYGSAEELAQTDAIARAPADVVRIVLGDSLDSQAFPKAT